MKLVLMGTGPFAVPSFDALRQAGHEISLVVTRPMPPVKSRGGPPPSPVRDWAAEHELPLYDPDSINEPEAIDRVKMLQPDLLVVCDYGQILKPDALATSKLGGINLHGSLLPAYRGAAPVQWALLNGDSVTGVSVIHMTPRLDGGPVMQTVETEITDAETSGELEQRLSELGVAATLAAVEKLASWDGESQLGIDQDASKVSKAPRLKKADGEIDWGRSASEISCHVRGMIPWPIAFTHYKPRENKPPLRLAIHAIVVTDQPSHDHSPGELLTTEDGVIIATGDRFIRIQTLQPAGKKPMTSTEFFRGYPVVEGARLFAS
ncbi:Methionyl-tRNA formyltransferase [Rubripirellula obstinata]|uniref:Methionyl-tRNA formyltransferase n=1 Tax=Rubripirellula obstinata TaxID=406547 RepID=A0A5B1CBQ9_9BACT|nr:methionyl-tRNA formyltransferase [Rubripirellula obstinata]KAA1257671.1 Methionyl-tRNA formyltransferase [Rubripirellula obstinata]